MRRNITIKEEKKEEITIIIIETKRVAENDEE